MVGNFEVIDFRFAKFTDNHDLKYKAWSRIYEYQYVIDFIKINKDISIPEIHNSSWGFEGVHVLFHDDLDLIGECIHSDIVHSEYRNTYYYDITTENREFANKFNFVINVSTIEHLETSDVIYKSIENLFKQVKPGGYLILTFDYPRVNLSEIESFIEHKCTYDVKDILNGSNSKIVDERYENLNIVYLILKKK